MKKILMKKILIKEILKNTNITHILKLILKHMEIFFIFLCIYKNWLITIYFFYNCFVYIYKND